jgi:hypothetical protein
VILLQLSSSTVGSTPLRSPSAHTDDASLAKTLLPYDEMLNTQGTASILRPFCDDRPVLADSCSLYHKSECPECVPRTDIHCAGFAGPVAQRRANSSAYRMPAPSDYLISTPQNRSSRPPHDRSSGSPPLSSHWRANLLESIATTPPARIGAKRTLR